MENMENVLKKKKTHIRRTRVNSAIITTLSIVGVLAVGLIAPNVLGALGRLGVIGPNQKRQNIKRSLVRLVESGYVVLENGRARLTPKGERFAMLLHDGRIAAKKPKRWDGKWRLLVFDVPEKRKYKRERIRSVLIHLGCKRLQDSVWVYPYDLEDVVTLLKTDLRIGKDLLYVIADAIENDAALRAHFKLI